MKSYIVDAVQKIKVHEVVWAGDLPGLLKPLEMEERSIHLLRGVFRRARLPGEQIVQVLDEIKTPGAQPLPEQADRELLVVRNVAAVVDDSVEGDVFDLVLEGAKAFFGALIDLVGLYPLAIEMRCRVDIKSVDLGIWKEFGPHADGAATAFIGPMCDFRLPIRPWNAQPDFTKMLHLLPRRGKVCLIDIGVIVGRPFSARAPVPLVGSTIVGEFIELQILSHSSSLWYLAGRHTFSRTPRQNECVAGAG